MEGLWKEEAIECIKQTWISGTCCGTRENKKSVWKTIGPVSRTGIFQIQSKNYKQYISTLI
jgi:hypothetical protein